MQGQTFVLRPFNWLDVAHPYYEGQSALLKGHPFKWKSHLKTPSQKHWEQCLAEPLGTDPQPSWHMACWIFFKTIFYSRLRSIVKVRGRYRDFSYTPHPYTCIASSINIPHQSGTSVTIDECILTHHYQPQSIVYIRVCFWCGAFYGSEQIYNMYLSLWYHMEYFHCPTIFLCSAYSSHPAPGNHWSFHYLQSFAFSRISYSWNQTVCSFKR